MEIQIIISEKAKNVIKNLKETVRKTPTGVSFVSIKGYENSFGEISNNLINIGVNYEKAKKDDVKTLENIDLTTVQTKTDLITLEKVRTELINELIKPNENRSYGQIDAYTNICTGLKVHNESGEIYIWGFRVKKTVVKEGVYPTVNSKPITIAKNELRKYLKTSKFTQYKVSNIEKMTLNGDTLEF